MIKNMWCKIVNLNTQTQYKTRTLKLLGFSGKYNHSKLIKFNSMSTCYSAPVKMDQLEDDLKLFVIHGLYQQTNRSTKNLLPDLYAQMQSHQNTCYDLYVQMQSHQNFCYNFVCTNAKPPKLPMQLLHSAKPPKLPLLLETTNWCVNMKINSWNNLKHNPM